jgi:hypothetical protein
VASLEKWLDLCQRLYAKGVDVFEGADVPVTEDGTRDPRVVALTLLARSMSQARSVVLLLDNNRVVEARTLTRSVYENMFWAAALVKKGDAFIEAIELDDITSRKKRAAGLLDWAKAQGEIADYHASLEAFRDRLWDDHGKTDDIKLIQAAQAGGVSHGYNVYRELSNDAAHPSSASLSRHVTLAEDGANGPPFTLHAEPPNDPMEAVDTLELLASALLGVIIAVNETVGFVNAGERLDAIAADFRQFSASNKADRERRRE